MTSFHGWPCWFELSSTNPDAAQAFYAPLFGWSWASAGMEGFDYRLARTPAARVAGLMKLPEGQPMPAWLLYIAVDDCDATLARAAGLGARTLHPATDIPGTGRFAVLADPQGAVFGLLQPLPMETPPESGAFDQMRPGHANWLELMSTDPAAALAFYGTLFGWTASQAMDMGAMGTYQLFARKGADIGGMMALGAAPVPNWLVYFGVPSVTAAMAQIGATGGKVQHGPMEVPGGAHIAVATDPQGAWFAVVGPLA